MINDLSASSSSLANLSNLLNRVPLSLSPLLFRNEFEQ